MNKRQQWFSDVLTWGTFIALGTITALTARRIYKKARGSK